MRKQPPSTTAALEEVDHLKNGDSIIDCGYVHTIAWIPDEPNGEVGFLAYYGRFDNYLGSQRMKVIYECPICNEHCTDKESALVHCRNLNNK